MLQYKVEAGEDSKGKGIKYSFLGQISIKGKEKINEHEIWVTNLAKKKGKEKINEHEVWMALLILLRGQSPCKKKKRVPVE